MLWWRKKKTYEAVGVESAREQLLMEKVRAERSEYRWNVLKRSFYAVAAVVLVGTYVYMIGNARGWFEREGDRSSEVPIIRINGEISGRSETASADALIAALRKGFKHDGQHIILHINSPGGSPSEAERVSKFIEAQKVKTKKNVVAVCGASCASAAYMIAVSADEVVAGDYSMVGSIGAIIGAWNVSAVAERLGAKYHVFASGKEKSMLNPFVPVSEEGASRAEEIVGRVGERFAEEVQKQRESLSKDEANIFSGGVWVGQDALALGLVDRLETYDETIERLYGEDAKRIIMNRAKTPIERALSSSIQMFIDAVKPSAYGGLTGS